MSRGVAIAVAAVTGVIATIQTVSCATDKSVSMRSCMRASFHDALGTVLEFGAFGAGLWVAVEIHRATKSNVLAWVCGLAVAFGLGFLLRYLGFNYAYRDRFDD